jgi:hypothetical protein
MYDGRPMSRIKARFRLGRRILRHIYRECTAFVIPLVGEVEQVWKKKRFGYPLIIVSFSVFLWFNWHIPPSGYAVVAMTVAAGVMAIRPEMGGWERSLWFVVLLCFAFIEIRAINRDRDRANKDFDNIVKGLQTAIDEGKTSIDKGNAAINGLQTTIAEGRQHFDQTIRGISGSINTQTGGDSYAFFTWVPMQGFLAFVHKGDYPLYDVRARIVDLDKIATESGLLGVTVSVGDMIKGHAKMEAVPPAIASTETHFNANIFFTARNGGWTQKFRAQKSKDGWARATIVSGEFVSLEKSRLLCETIDKGFLLDSSGRVEKDWTPNSALPRCQ